MRFNGYRVWCADVFFTPSASLVHVNLVGATEAGPTAWQRQKFRELIEQFGSLRRKIQGPLATEYERTRTERRLACIPVEEPSQIWKVALLQWITIHDEGSSTDLEMDHRVDCSEEEYFINVSIKDGRVLEVKMD